MAHSARQIFLKEINEEWCKEHLVPSKGALQETAKRSFDIVFSLIGLVVLAALFPLIALSIKLTSPGPIFYVQPRMGRNGRDFLFYKFRTMVHRSDGTHVPWRELDKDQITKAGRVLRKLELDEFPQFWNILKGDMSFVGPRPEWVDLARDFEQKIPLYKYRSVVRPGFTGWAQLHYPPSTSLEQAKEKFEYDLYYMKNRSFFLDLSIILRTFRIVFR